MHKHRLDIDKLKVQSLVTVAGTKPVRAGWTTLPAQHTVIEPGYTDECIPSVQTCNCYTHPWC